MSIVIRWLLFIPVAFMSAFAMAYISIGIEKLIPGDFGATIALGMGSYIFGFLYVTLGAGVAPSYKKHASVLLAVVGLLYLMSPYLTGDFGATQLYTQKSYAGSLGYILGSLLAVVLCFRKNRGYSHSDGRVGTIMSPKWTLISFVVGYVILSALPYFFSVIRQYQCDSRREEYKEVYEVAGSFIEQYKKGDISMARTLMLNQQYPDSVFMSPEVLREIITSDSISYDCMSVGSSDIFEGAVLTLPISTRDTIYYVDTMISKETGLPFAAERQATSYSLTFVKERGSWKIWLGMPTYFYNN